MSTIDDIIEKHVNEIKSIDGEIEKTAAALKELETRKVYIQGRISVLLEIRNGEDGDGDGGDAVTPTN